jgi:hypothetical protein
MEYTEYQQLLTKQCSIIADSVSKDMKKNIFHIGGVEMIPVPHNAILYRWWFLEESEPMKELKKYVENHPHDIIMRNMLSNLEKRELGKQTYYALYFGKSSNGYNRYRQHSTGNVNGSTLRRTINGLCIGGTYDKANEEQITELLKQCYYEWADFGNEENIVECIEGICIALGNYPLNIDGNAAISNEWREYVTKERKLKNS